MVVGKNERNMKEVRKQNTEHGIQKINHRLTVLKDKIRTTRANLYQALGSDWNNQEEEILAVGKNERK